MAIVSDSISDDEVEPFEIPSWDPSRFFTPFFRLEGTGILAGDPVAVTEELGLPGSLDCADVLRRNAAELRPLIGPGGDGLDTLENPPEPNPTLSPTPVASVLFWLLLLVLASLRYNVGRVGVDVCRL